MKDKDTKLERLENELFSSFNSDDESWIGGTQITKTVAVTYTPAGPEVSYDLDFWDFDAQS